MIGKNVRILALVLALVMVFSSTVFAAEGDHFIKADGEPAYSANQVRADVVAKNHVRSLPGLFQIEVGGKLYDLAAANAAFNQDKENWKDILTSETDELEVVEVSAINNMSIEVTFEGIEEPVVIELEEALVHGQTGVSFLYLEVEYTAELTVAYVDPAVVAAEKEAAIDAAKEAIHAIGYPDVLTLEDEAKVVNARNLVSLAEELGALEVDFGTGNLDHLEEAELVIADLAAKLEARNKAYDYAKLAIINLPMAKNITLDHEMQVESAKKAYADLELLAVGDLALTTDETEALNHWKLQKAVEKIAELSGYKEAADLLAAQAVDALIAKFKSAGPINEEFIGKVEAAKTAYDLLTIEQQALVAGTNVQKLDTAVQTLSDLYDDVDALKAAVEVAKEAMVEIEDEDVGAVAVQDLVEAAKDLATAINNDYNLDVEFAIIEAEKEWLEEADGILAAILVAVNASNTEPQLLGSLVNFTAVKNNLINDYRMVLGNDVSIGSLEEVQGIILLVNLYKAPNQLDLLDLLADYFPDVVNGETFTLIDDYDLLNDYEEIIVKLFNELDKTDHPYPGLLGISEMDKVTKEYIKEKLAEVTDWAKAAQDVDSLISALPVPVTLVDEDAVIAAEEALEALEASENEYVLYESILDDARDVIDELRAAEVDGMILDLPGGVIIEDHVIAILTVWDAYELLSENQKVLLDNLDNLQVLHVKALIFNLPTEVTVEHEVAIEFARDAYNALELEQPGEVEPNELQKLLDAELALAVLFAKEAVVAAEGSELQADVNAAQLLVTALPAGAEKDGFQDRLDAVQDIIDVATVVLVVLSLETDVPHNYSGTNSSSYSTYTLPTTNIEWSKTGNAISSVVNGIVTFAYDNNGLGGWDSRTSTLTATITVGTASDTVVFAVETDRSGFNTRIWSIELAE